MPRPSQVIDDRTPLNAARIDVNARIGWFLRTHRTVAGLSLRQMSTALRDHGITLSAASLSRTESDGLRSNAVMDGYTQVLALPEGALYAGIDFLCMSFPYSPKEQAPGPVDLRDFDSAIEGVSVAQPTGGAWLRFAQMHQPVRGFGLPTHHMTPLAARLVGESGRGVALSRATRFSALVKLLESPYGVPVSEAMMRAVDDPRTQDAYDLTGSLSELPTRQVLDWAGHTLCHAPMYQATGASFTLQAMLVGGGLSLDHWKSLVPALADAWCRAAGEPARRAILLTVIRSLPERLQSMVDDLVPGIPGPLRPGVAWARRKDNPHFDYAASLAAAACRRLDHPAEPLLERLVFEALFEPRGVRMASASWLLMCSAFADALRETILDEVGRAPDPLSRRASTRLAAQCCTGARVPAVEGLLSGLDRTDFRAATTIIGRSGGRLPDAHLRSGLCGDEETVRQTLYCLGMSGDDRLPLLAEDPGLPESTRSAARWWLDRGPRLLD